MAKITRIDWRTWLRGIWSAIIQGGSGAVLGSLGLLGGNLVGADVRPLDFKQVGGVFLGAAVIRLLFFLNGHPVPDEETESTPTNPPLAPP